MGNGVSLGFLGAGAVSLVQGSSAESFQSRPGILKSLAAGMSVEPRSCAITAIGPWEASVFIKVHYPQLQITKKVKYDS